MVVRRQTLEISLCPTAITLSIEAMKYLDETLMSFSKGLAVFDAHRNDRYTDTNLSIAFSAMTDEKKHDVVSCSPSSTPEHQDITVGTVESLSKGLQVESEVFGAAGQGQVDFRTVGWVSRFRPNHCHVK